MLRKDGRLPSIDMEMYCSRGEPSAEPSANKELVETLRDLSQVRGESGLVDGHKRLFDLGFFVENVLSNNRIELHDFHLVRHGSLVLAGGVEMASTS